MGVVYGCCEWVLCGCCLGVVCVLCACCVGVVWVLCGCCVRVVWVLCGCCVGVVWVVRGCCVGIVLVEIQIVSKVVLKSPLRPRVCVVSWKYERNEGSV